MKRELAPYKYPRRVEFVDALPKTETGKIRRVELRQRERGQPGLQALGSRPVWQCPAGCARPAYRIRQAQSLKPAAKSEDVAPPERIKHAARTGLADRR